MKHKTTTATRQAVRRYQDKYKYISVRVSTDVYRRLRALAVEDNTSLSAYINNIIKGVIHE